MIRPSARFFLFVMLGAILVPVLVACGAPNEGAKDVISPAVHRKKEMAKDKHEGP